MDIRARKLLGSIGLIVFVIVYFLFATSVTSVWIGDRPGVLQALGYAFFGLIWIVPAGAIISWMSKSP